MRRPPGVDQAAHAAPDMPARELSRVGPPVRNVFVKAPSQAGGRSSCTATLRRSGQKSFGFTSGEVNRNHMVPVSLPGMRMDPGET